jgi:hypothetical protein
MQSKSFILAILFCNSVKRSLFYILMPLKPMVCTFCKPLFSVMWLILKANFFILGPKAKLYQQERVMMASQTHFLADFGKRIFQDNSLQQSPKNFYYFYLPAPRVVAVTADRRPSMAPSNASNVNTVGSNLFGVYDSPTMLPRTPLAPGMYLY